MSEYVWIDKEQAKRIHDHEISMTGGSFGLRDEGLLESAINRPRNLYAYGSPDVFELAAAYAEGISQNHSFIDGNKRTAYQVANVFLESNGRLLSPEADNEYYGVFVKLASGNLSSEELANFYRDHSRPLEQSQTREPIQQTSSQVVGGKTMPILETILAGAAAPEIVEDTAASIREGVGAIAKTAASEVAPQGEQTAELNRQETPEERGKRFKEMMEDARRANEEDQENEIDQTQEHVRGGRGR